MLTTFYEQCFVVSITLQGGGQMALIFYQPLPPGNKVVVYISRINPNYVVTQQAFEENNMALVCAIPSELSVIFFPVSLVYVLSFLLVQR